MDAYLKSISVQSLKHLLAQWAKAQAWYAERLPEDYYTYESLERALCAGEKRLCHVST